MKTLLDDLLISRAGLPGIPPDQNKNVLRDIKVERPGEEGETYDIKIVRPDGEGGTASIIYKEHDSDPKLNGVQIERPGELGSPQDFELKRGGTTYKLEKFQVTRGGTVTVPEDFQVERSGAPGRKDPPTIKRGGNEGKLNPPDIQRSGTEGRIQDIEVTRPGELGSTQDIDTQRPGNPGSVNPPNIIRPGNPGTINPPVVQRPEGAGTLDPPEVQRPGTEGVHTNITTTRPDSPDPDLGVERPGVPENTNKFAAGDDKVSTISEFIRRYNKLASQISGWAGVAGFDTPDVGNITGLLNKLGLGNNAKLLSNVSYNTLIDLQGYFKHLMSNDWNWGRIPLDIGLREWLKFKRGAISEARELLYNNYKKGELSDPDARRLAGMQEHNKRVLYETGGQLQPIMAGTANPIDSKLIQRPQVSDKSATKPDNNYTDPLLEYLGYQVTWIKDALTDDIPTSRGTYTILTRSIADRLSTATWDDTGKLGNLKPYTENGKEVDKNYYSGNYNWWRGFEMSDDIYWGLRIRPFEDSQNGIKSLLPSFPIEFDNGWWPVLSCAFTKNSLKSKTFNFPFFALTIPYQGERPSKLKMEVLDNQRRAIRYWLESYVAECFDLDHNYVLPYKNICWDIMVYRYDMTMNILYSKRLICLLSEFNCGFNGATSHVSDEIDLNFEIVGEYMTENRKTGPAIRDMDWVRTHS